MRLWVEQGGLRSWSKMAGKETDLVLLQLGAGPGEGSCSQKGVSSSSEGRSTHRLSACLDAGPKPGEGGWRLKSCQHPDIQDGVRLYYTLT